MTSYKNRPPRAEFRVLWADWRGHHDWVGPGATWGGRPRGKKSPPPTQSRDFYTREGAKRLVAKLRREIPRGELVVQIIALHKPDPEPADRPLPGEWPRQGPAMREEPK